MREHIGLFRGKRIDTGDWVEGWLVIKKDPLLEVTYCFILAYGKGESYVTWYPVDPDTIGECTGLKGLAEMMLFEHDVVTAKFKSTGARFNFKIIFKAGMFLFDNGCVAVPFNEIRSAVKIGNIHDNPELLKGGEG